VVAAAPEAAPAVDKEDAVTNQLRELWAEIASVKQQMGLKADTSHHTEPPVLDLHDTALPVLAGQDGLTVCDTPA
jgi:hypothetical protein